MYFSSFTCITEFNTWEGETWNYYFDNHIFQEVLPKLHSEVAKWRGRGSFNYAIDPQPWTQRRVEAALTLNREHGYRPRHNLVYAVKDKSWPMDHDPIYKGNNFLFGPMALVVLHRRWKMANPQQPLPPLIREIPMVAARLYDGETPSHEWFVVGKSWGFCGGAAGLIAPGERLLDPATGALIQLEKVEAVDNITYKKYGSLNPFVYEDATGQQRYLGDFTYLSFVELSKHSAYKVEDPV